jgi:hypothetical protein
MVRLYSHGHGLKVEDVEVRDYNYEIAGETRREKVVGLGSVTFYGDRLDMLRAFEKVVEELRKPISIPRRSNVGIGHVLTDEHQAAKDAS